jgi:outer membrane protein assembly factor BamB
MSRAVWLFTFSSWFFLLAEPAPAEDLGQRVSIPGESAGAARRLQSVRKLAEEQAKLPAAQQRWSPIVEEVERILNEAGDNLVAIDGEQSIQARWLCHRALSRLPAGALQLHRDRVEVKTKPWLEQGVAQRDEALLQRIVNEAFCSRQAETALDVLGDLAFERGEFEAAQRWWGQLARPLGNNEGDEQLVYPRPRHGVAGPRAKQLMARLFRGDAARLPPELALFRQQHAGATGHLAGKDGEYGDILQSLRTDAAKLTEERDESWPTFAGSASRQRILPPHPRDPDRLSWLLQDDPVCFDLARRLRIEKPTPEPPAAPVLAPSAEARSFAFFPVVVGNRVVVSDGRSVSVYEPATGSTHTWEPEQATLRDLVAIDNKLPAAPDVRYTLTAAGDRIFVRLGPNGVESEGAKHLLLCLRLLPTGKLQYVWHLRPAAESDGGIRIEGSPLVQNGKLYTAVTRIAGNQVVTAVHCYPADTDAAPALRWRQDVCSVADRSGEARFRQHLLTLAGPNVVYASDSGAIVALDAGSGKRIWARRYAAQAAHPNGAPPASRDLTPCLFADGRLFAAPADADTLCCLDPDTGRKLWDREHVEVVQLYGVAQGRLVFTTPLGIRAVDVASGLDAGGWFQPGDGTTLAPLGRGLLAGDLVVWPTRAGLCVLDQSDGEQPYGVNPVPIRDRCPRGNVLFANGMLIVAGAKELFVFVPPRQKLDERRAAAKNEPESALALYRLAIAEADAGLPAAPNTFVEASRRVRSDERGQGESLREMVLCDWQRTLFASAQREGNAGRHDAAVDALVTAAHIKCRPDQQLRAFLHLASFLEEHKEPDLAVSVWQSILKDARLREALMPLPQGRAESAAFHARKEIARLLQAYECGECRTKFEKDARDLLADARRDNDRIRLTAVVETYPNFPAGQEGLKELIAACEATNQPGAAEHWRQCGVALRGAASTNEQISPLVRRNRETARAGQLVRHWELKLEAGERFLPLEEDASGAVPLFFTRERHLRCVEERTGKERWRVELAEPPRWAGCHGGCVLVASPVEICSLCLDDGQVFWRFVPPDFTNTDNAAPRRPLTAFRLASHRLACIEDGRRLFVLDPDTGEVLWARWAPGATLSVLAFGGRFLPEWDADDHSIVTQIASGERWLLDARTGNVRYRGSTTAAWVQPVLRIDERRSIVVPDARRIVSFDREGGKEIWSFTPPCLTNLSGEPPRLLGSSDALLAVIARNHGYFLQRLDPATGQPIWNVEPALGAVAVEPSQIAITSTAFCWANRGTLVCCDLASGKRLWEQPWPAPGPWRIATTPNGLLLHPLKPPENPATDDFPIEIRDPLSGSLLQRLHFRATVRFYPQDLTPSAKRPDVPRARVQSIAWPQVSLSNGGVIVVGSEFAWRFGW